MTSIEEQTLYQSNVELYDIAFSWDIDHEVSWLLKHLGNQCHSILEPGCGPGRMLEAFAKTRIEIVGVDNSKEGIALAQKRIAAMTNASAILGDMTNFNLGRTFDGAVCPINTLAILTPGELERHLKCMSRHLRADARYMVQIAIRNPNKSADNENSIEWEASRDNTHLRIKVWVEEVDYKQMRELHGFKIIIEKGPRAGEIIEEKHWMTIWTAEAWRKIIDESNFSQNAQYDGDDPSYPTVSIGSCGNLMWHELIRK
jgi:SAM-dependent methyltransferase